MYIRAGYARACHLGDQRNGLQMDLDDPSESTDAMHVGHLSDSNGLEDFLDHFVQYNLLHLFVHDWIDCDGHDSDSH